MEPVPAVVQEVGDVLRESQVEQLFVDVARVGKFFLPKSVALL